MSKVRKMLSNWEAPYIQSLIMKLIETQSKASLAIWAVDYSELVILPLWSKYYPDDLRPKNVLNAAREWLSGAIKLPQAKTAILECHAAAAKLVRTCCASRRQGDRSMRIDDPFSTALYRACLLWSDSGRL